MAASGSGDNLLSDILSRFDDKELRSVAETHVKRCLNRATISLEEKQEETRRYEIGNSENVHDMS